MKIGCSLKINFNEEIEELDERKDYENESREEKRKQVKEMMQHRIERQYEIIDKIVGDYRHKEGDKRKKHEVFGEVEANPLNVKFGLDKEYFFEERERVLSLRSSLDYDKSKFEKIRRANIREVRNFDKEFSDVKASCLTPAYVTHIGSKEIICLPEEIFKLSPRDNSGGPSESAKETAREIKNLGEIGV